MQLSEQRLSKVQENVTLSARAAGYRSYSQTIATAELRAAPQRDIGLQPFPRLWLPVIVR